MAPVFGYGDMRLYLLMLLEEAPRYGYELIRLLEGRFGGNYTPSAGAIYPRLAALEEEGLVIHSEEDGRKVYRLTDDGRDELTARGGDLRDLEEKVSDWATDLAKSVLGGAVRSTLRGLQGDLRDGLRASRRDVRDAAQDARREATRARSEAHRVAADARNQARAAVRDATRAVRSEGRSILRSLRYDLEAFGNDILDAAESIELDREVLRKIQSTLLDARASIAELLGIDDVREDDVHEGDPAEDALVAADSEVATSDGGAPEANAT